MPKIKHMPTLYRDGNLKVCMYSNDHSPPHFHVLTPDERASVTIEGLQILAGELSNKTMNKAKKWAQDHKVELTQKWEEING